MTEQVEVPADLGVKFREALRSMHAGEPQIGANGRHQQIDDSTRISIDEGMALFSLCVAGKVTATLEVGLAYGFSTVYLLAALEQNGGGTHTAIDPYQARDWDGIGLTTASQLVATANALTFESFELLEERSDLALADLERAGRTFGLTFIDGYHRFDDVLVDFTLAARMCPIGGTIVLHDMWLDSIAAVASFLRRNRLDFAEIATGCDNLFAVRRVDQDRRD
ncbi:MAG: class I SAM-dependent methyltransferase, partial [Actinomycetes bacterium]